MGSAGAECQNFKDFNPRLLPPFPEDTTPCVELETLSLEKLEAGDSAEQARLLDICCTRGFFMLDFSGTSYEGLPQDAEDVAHLSTELFRLPMEEKMKHVVFKQKPYSIIGYKNAGFTKTDAKGTADTSEFWNIGKDDILDVPGRHATHPPALVFDPPYHELLSRFARHSHRAGLNIMSMIANQLELPADIFEDKHRIDKPTDSQIRMTHAPARQTADLPEIQTPGHTDFGTITILFNWLGGLQVWSEPSRGTFHQLFDGTQNGTQEARWLWVKPKPGCAIVNLGDAAVKFTGGILCSARHRVVPPPGAQGAWPRHSVVYFVRPEDDCPLKRISGGKVPPLKEGEEEEVMTAVEWIKKQATQLRDGKPKEGKVELD